MPVLYGIVDGARDHRLHALATATSEHACLFAGKLEPSLERAAPFLVRLDSGSRLLAAWRSEGWGNAWGILCISSASLGELRRHFRRFLQARLPDGRTVLFRFYDPRVFRAHLPACSTETLAAWFACVDEFRVEAEDGAGVQPFRLSATGLNGSAATGSGLDASQAEATSARQAARQPVLAITDEQLALLRANAGRSFHLRLVPWLRRHAPPAQTMPEPKLLALVARQQPRAARYGLIAERDIAKWCLLALLTTETFDELPGIGAYLANGHGERPGARLDALMRSYAQALDRKA